MADLCQVILMQLEKVGEVDSLTLGEDLKADHQKIVGAVKSLQALGEIIEVEQKTRTHFELTTEGEEVVERGSHEALVFNAVPATGILQADIMKNISKASIGFNKAMACGWIRLDKNTEGESVVYRKVDTINDDVQKDLKKILEDHNDFSAAQIKEYKKRNLMTEIKVNSYIIKKGIKFTTTITKPETDLTAEMIALGSWKDHQFKTYNFDALGVMPSCGHLHPLLKVRSQYRQIFLEMGFTEMPTNNFVESSFWNFDALFQPQQHPARDVHDTFFLSDPQLAAEDKLPMNYLEKVKCIHSKGGYGSQGYKYNWKLLEAQKNIMRTHTTAVSARLLYKLAQQTPFKPAKYFSIDRVFRNETLDATHLAEFHQIEGLVVDHNLTLGDLMGVIHAFFQKLGIMKLRFKPAYNPYTEPSMEIFGYHDGLKKWVEIGNSGLFRPEMLLPMGFPNDVCVIAWGLSLERPTMILYGIDNIRELMGPKVNLQMVYNNPICWVHK